ncbi:MAG TPA: hypothetical protein VIT66_06625 [Lysobacter sp.]
MEHVAIPVRSSTIVRALAVFAAVLVAAGTALELVKYLTGHDHVFGLIGLFNLDYERNIPTLYSVVLLLCAFGLLALIAMLEQRSTRRDVTYWVVLAIGFLGMAVDEACSLHETLDVPIRARFKGVHFGLLYYVWVVPAGVLVAALGLYFLGFLRRLPAATRRGFIVAAVIYLGGAVGVELFEGRLHEAYGTQNLGYSLLVAVEEGMEMAGVIIFIHALLNYLGRRHPHLRIQIVATQRQAKLRRPDAYSHVGEPEFPPPVALGIGRQQLRRSRLRRRE